MKSTPMFAAVAGLEAVMTILLAASGHTALAVAFAVLTLFTSLAAAASRSRGA